MKNKILILGQGFIGRRLQEGFKCDISSKKIYSYADAEGEIKRFRPDILINCIGFTGKNNVDDCENDKDKTISANVFVPVILAEAALRNNVRLVHISSGCIYHYDYAKDIPIHEEKEPDFFELFYSRAKIYGERVLSTLLPERPILIARIRVPVDNRPHPRNLLTKLINYKKVIDIPNSITYIPDFIDALRHLIDIEAKGIYNIVNKDPLIYSELLKVYKKYVPDYDFEIIDFKKINLIRTNLILSTRKLENTGFKARRVKEILEECVKEYIKS
ncbi:MAG: sugar nucleotide-binding protein [Candidatus Omnitrophica bacterium]|nr:sugar nucleotide-binding protein [Candidatus Omnitrophota bacterium]MDD5553392.1 sugar nucleotide-binding protein [Candidatus Omnitrophota bacterium]